MSVLTGEQISIRKEKLQEVLQQLEWLQDERRRLHDENVALAALIAEQRVRLQTQESKITPELESMTWEQRRALIMQQLQREDAYDP